MNPHESVESIESIEISISYIESLAGAPARRRIPQSFKEGAKNVGLYVKVSIALGILDALTKSSLYVGLDYLRYGISITSMLSIPSGRVGKEYKTPVPRPHNLEEDWRTEIAPRAVVRSQSNTKQTTTLDQGWDSAHSHNRSRVMALRN